MKVSLNWLKEYLELDNYSDDDLKQAIGFHVCEIETYTKMVNATNLTIGQVLECINHPNSDHLHICQVDVGSAVLQIVCGALNVDINQKVIVALEGAILPGDFKIKKSTVRGVESNGMICSLQELGIEEKYIKEEFKNGIYILENNAVVGTDPLKYLGYDDTIIDLELTSNRSDLMSIEGVAYDLGAVINQQINPKKYIPTQISKENPLFVEIQTKNCYQYNVRKIENIKIMDSPLWMRARLIASGVRPINNVVDITNYVMLEMGQPLHAFDSDVLKDKIIVRNAFANEEFTTLDGIKRVLNESDVVITDGVNVHCLGGVMGGLLSEVTSNTINVTLEAAVFDPLAIRKTSTRLQLKSESSTRFERKVDQLRIKRALDYASYLLGLYATGDVLNGMVSVINIPYEIKSVNITVDKINKVLGTNLSKEIVSDIFNRLAYKYELKNEIYTIELPSRRMDLEPSVQDIIEDVVRVYGFDNVPTTLADTEDRGYLTYKQQKIRAVRQALANMGLNEVVTYSLISEKELNDFTYENFEPIKLLMPITEERALMRYSLLNGVLEAMKYNIARKMDNLAFFEIGNRYSTTNEELMLAIGMCGEFSSLLWNGKKDNVDFFLLKGIIETLFEKLNIEVDYIKDITIKNLHPGRSAKIIYKEEVIGFIGNIHPKYRKDNDLKDTYVLEISLDKIIKNEEEVIQFSSINKYPTITRDLAIVVKKEIEASSILKVIKQTAKKNLFDLQIFDLYTGENVGQNEKSIAFKLIFEDKTKTLETSDVDKIVKSILNRLDYNFKAKLRE